MARKWSKLTSTPMRNRRGSPPLEARTKGWHWQTRSQSRAETIPPPMSSTTTRTAKGRRQTNLALPTRATQLTEPEDQRTPTVSTNGGVETIADSTDGEKQEQANPRRRPKKHRREIQAKGSNLQLNNTSRRVAGLPSPRCRPEGRQRRGSRRIDGKNVSHLRSRLRQL
jgi:hypothetical protein